MLKWAYPSLNLKFTILKNMKLFSIRVKELFEPIVSRGGHLYFRLNMILVKGLSKHTLNTYFSGINIDRKYAFLNTFFLIGPSCPFQNLSIWPKHTLFSNFARFCTPKRCTCVHCLVLKNNPNYVNFSESLSLSLSLPHSLSISPSLSLSYLVE